jgi:FxsC-like protein
MLFFFSYARADLSPFLKRFYEDLREAVRSKAGEPQADRVAFRDAVSIEPGRPWPEEIVDALHLCKVFVFLHTPTYYSRDGCGKEFRIIKNRFAAFHGNAAALAAASCIQPIYWDGEKELLNVPPEVAGIQVTHEEYGDDYCKHGMLQITRASYGKQVYWDAINLIAQRIKTAADGAPLPELQQRARWENIEPFFPSVPAVQPITLAAAKLIRTPRYARFVWVVGRRDELAPNRCVEYLESYDPDGIAEEWRPFLPDTTDPARLVAADAAREAQLSYLSDDVPQNQQELQRLIEQAGDTYTPIVVVSDLWSLRLHKYQAVIGIFERGKLDNCAVIFPWNLKDEDINSQQVELRKMLSEIFPVQFHKPETSLIFEGISDVFTFKAELSKLLTKYVADINRSMKVVRELPKASPFSAPPQLGPTPT